jgi:hypothetical protein
MLQKDCNPKKGLTAKTTTIRTIPHHDRIMIVIRFYNGLKEGTIFYCSDIIAKSMSFSVLPSARDFQSPLHLSANLV